ncbi:hypothetical protein AB0N81_01280 [Streptomyces sp. NPDC093510]|uniref:hypothetical protein n=1 Tax=Streptomyces sp. NPDC093510 TaxID=3155199 RepID=UPI003438E0C1
MQLVPPPRIPANEVRPGRHWYVTAAAIAVVLTVLGVLGVGFGVYRFSGAVDAVGAVDTGHRFADGDTVTLRLEQGSDKAIWIKDRGPSPAQECRISGPGDPRLTDPGIDVFLTRDETWNPLHTIDVPRRGDYEITCSSKGPSRYAIGGTEGHLTLVGGLMTAALLPLLGIGVGIGIGVCTAIVIVTAVRRHAHRKRLLAERDRHGSTGDGGDGSNGSNGSDGSDSPALAGPPDPAHRKLVSL